MVSFKKLWWNKAWKTPDPGSSSIFRTSSPPPSIKSRPHPHPRGQNDETNQRPNAISPLSGSEVLTSDQAKARRSAEGKGRRTFWSQVAEVCSRDMIQYEINPALYTQDLRFSDSLQNSPVEKLGLLFGWYCYCVVVKRCLVYFDSGTQGSSFRPLRALRNAETESCSFCRSTVRFGGTEDWTALSTLSTRKNWGEWKLNGNWSVLPCLLFGELTNKTGLARPCFMISRLPVA